MLSPLDYHFPIRILHSCCILAFFSMASFGAVSRYAEWTYHKRIFLNTTESGAYTSQQLRGFPLYLKLDSTNFDFSQLKATGDDIRVTDSNGRPLSYEIECWKPNIAEIWIKIDTMYANNSSAYITMHWGNPRARSQSNHKAVFSPRNGFLFWLHLYRQCLDPVAYGASIHEIGKLLNYLPRGNNWTEARNFLRRFCRIQSLNNPLQSPKSQEQEILSLCRTAFTFSFWTHSALDEWQYHVYIYSAGHLEYYRNAVLQDSCKPLPDSITLIDEMQLSNVARTHDWIWVSWKNRMPDSPLLSFHSIRLLCSSKEMPIKSSDQRNVTFLVNFLPPDTGLYHIEFIQEISPPFHGVSAVADIPPDGYSSRSPVTWPISTFILSDEPSDTFFTLRSIARVLETGEADTAAIDIRLVTDQPVPSLLPLSSDPSALHIFDSTEVTFTTVLEGTEDTPSFVMLQEVDSTGDVVQSLGFLNDDGSSGDLSAGDFVYSGSWVLSYSTEALRYYRALAAYGSAGDTAYSPFFELPVTRFPTETINLLTDSLGNETGRIVYDPSVGDSIISNGAVVSFKKGTAPDRIIGIVNEVGGGIAGTFSSLEFFQIQLPSPGSVGEIHAIIDALSAYSEVESTESIPVDHTTVATPAELRPNPTQIGEYYFDRVRAREAWVISKGKVLISIVDTGIDWDHPDLTGKVRKGRNYLEWKKDKKYNSKDNHGHGTHVASIASARTNNEDVPETHNSAGMSWGSDLLAVKVLDKDGEGSRLDGHNGVEYSADKGARIINCSFGGNTHRNYFQRAIDHANAKGSIVVCAAGNNGNTKKFYPAAYSGAFAVAATDDSDSRPTWSNYGSWVHLCAPGTSILAAEMGGDRISKNGTSMAAPVVSGTAAAIWERFPSATSGTIKTLLKQSAAPLTISGMGSGRLDVFEAIFNGSFEIQPITETIKTFNARGQLLKTENREIAYWRRSGNVDFITQLGPYAPQNVDGHSGRMAFISTGGAGYNGLIVSSISQRLTIDNTSYEALNNHTLPISLNYNYVTEEYPEWVGSIYNDKMRVILKHPSGREDVLVYNDINTTPFTMLSNLDLPEGDATTGATGWRSFSTVVNLTDGPGVYELIISVEDAGDDLWNSVVLVDNIRFRQ